MNTTTLPPDRAADAVDVLCEAFRDYPVMRRVIGPCGQAYTRRLRTLVEFFVAARFLRNDLVTAVVDTRDRVVAVATVVTPGEREAPKEMSERRRAVWQELGADARARYEAYGESWKLCTVEQPHHHLSMLGVYRADAGQGYARRLLDDLHERSCRHLDSCGVTLNTEDPQNVPIYQHFGYRVIAHAALGDGGETWGFFRPNDSDCE